MVPQDYSHDYYTKIIAQRKLASKKKADKSPVTQADREAEALLEKALAELVPHIQVIGEEACAGSQLGHVSKNPRGRMR